MKTLGEKNSIPSGSSKMIVRILKKKKKEENDVIKIEKSCANVLVPIWRQVVGTD